VFDFCRSQERQRVGVGFDNVTAVVIKFEPVASSKSKGSSGRAAGGLDALSLGP